LAFGASTQMRPDADVLDVGGVLRLPQVGRAGQQHHAAVGAQIQTLEKDVAERVVAGQVIHALLTEDQQPVEPARLHQRDGAFAPAGQFGFGEMQRHASAP
jgi:hypothetical protein